MSKLAEVLMAQNPSLFMDYLESDAEITIMVPDETDHNHYEISQSKEVGSHEDKINKFGSNEFDSLILNENHMISLMIGIMLKLGKTKEYYCQVVDVLPLESSMDDMYEMTGPKELETMKHEIMDCMVTTLDTLTREIQRAKDMKKLKKVLDIMELVKLEFES